MPLVYFKIKDWNKKLVLTTTEMMVTIPSTGNWGQCVCVCVLHSEGHTSLAERDHRSLHAPRTESRIWRRESRLTLQWINACVRNRPCSVQYNNPVLGEDQNMCVTCFYCAVIKPFILKWTWGSRHCFCLFFPLTSENLEEFRAQTDVFWFSTVRVDLELRSDSHTATTHPPGTGPPA